MIAAALAGCAAAAQQPVAVSGPLVPDRGVIVSRPQTMRPAYQPPPSNAGLSRHLEEIETQVRELHDRLAPDPQH